MSKLTIISCLLSMALLLASLLVNGQSGTRCRVDSVPGAVTYRTFCKGFLLYQDSLVSSVLVPGGHTLLEEPAFKVSGSFLYDLNYRSLVDTPFAARELMQHYLQLNLNVLVANKFPVQVILATRRSNSGYFRDFHDISLRFDQRDFSRATKDRLLALLQQTLLQQGQITSVLEQQWQRAASEVQESRSFLQHPGHVQELIEAKEYLQKASSFTPSTKPRSIKPDGELRTLAQKSVSKFRSSSEAKEVLANYNAKKEKLDSLQQRADSLRKVYTKQKSEVTGKVDSLRKQMNGAVSGRQLRRMNPGAYDSLSFREKLLLGMKTVALGRSVVNYSELSVQNIGITGINLEYSSNYYWAVAAGGVDYRFRDFMIGSERQARQRLGLIRFGRQSDRGDHLILTAYNGRKSNYNFSASSAALQPVYGLTLESRYQVTPDHYIVGEIAKSSALSPDSRGGIRNTTLRLSDLTSLAASVRFSAWFRKTDTRFTGGYRYMGANFQSFSLFTSTANQTAWNVSLDQPFFKRALKVKASIRRNEFESPYLANAYQSGVVFKSLFVSLRKRGLPHVSLGYMPTTQLTKIGTELIQYQFYMTVGTVSHFYRLGRLYCTALATASRYQATGPAAALPYANSDNLTLSHTITGQQVSVMTSVSHSQAPGYRLAVVDQGLTWNCPGGIVLGGGVKFNQLNLTEERLGGYGNLLLPLKRLGDLSLSYETNYLPAVKGGLTDYNLGRITYHKRF